LTKIHAKILAEKINIQQPIYLWSENMSCTSFWDFNWRHLILFNYLLIL